MKIMSLIAALVATAALTALGQEGVVQDVKHGAKKTGETIKDGVETVGEKTKDTAKTVGKKTKETGRDRREKDKGNGRRHGRKSSGDHWKKPPQVQKHLQQNQSTKQRRAAGKSRGEYAGGEPQ